ncbi:DUF2278 family protein [Saccharopolyspora sp. NPDC002376]
MALRSYGVLSGQVVESHREGFPDESPHYQIHVLDDTGTHYQVPVNVKSAEAPSDLLYLVSDDFVHPILGTLPARFSGWTALPPGPGHANLDYIRGNLFEPSEMRTLPPDARGPDNDLEDLLDHYIRRAQADSSACVYAFGDRFGPKKKNADKVSGSAPSNGVHDVHMNQGNSADFRRDDGVWQDGGLLLHFATEQRWVAIFLAFQSQAWHTDDRTGHALVGAAPRPKRGREQVRIAAVLANPVGAASETETVTLINASPESVDLTGWQLVDGGKHKNRSTLPEGQITPGATVQVPAADLQLSSGDGVISLINAHGEKVHGVSYSAEQGSREGWTLVF